jgi:hypothetical protein
VGLSLNTLNILPYFLHDCITSDMSHVTFIFVLFIYFLTDIFVLDYSELVPCFEAHLGLNLRFFCLHLPCAGITGSVTMNRSPKHLTAFFKIFFPVFDYLKFEYEMPTFVLGHLPCLFLSGFDSRCLH